MNVIVHLIGASLLEHPMDRNEEKVKRNKAKKDLTSISSIIRKLEFFVV
jgi:hypothetical protein